MIVIFAAPPLQPCAPSPCRREKACACDVAVHHGINIVARPACACLRVVVRLAENTKTDNKTEKTMQQNILRLLHRSSPRCPKHNLPRTHHMAPKGISLIEDPGREPDFSEPDAACQHMSIFTHAAGANSVSRAPAFAVSQHKDG